MSKRHYLVRIGDLISQGVNTVVLFGEPDESVSGRCYRKGTLEQGSAVWRFGSTLIDLVFKLWEDNHCENAYWADIQRAKERVKEADRLKFFFTMDKEI